MPGQTPTLTSPNIGNIKVPRGYLAMELAGEDTYQDMGNVTEFEIELKPTILDHYSARTPVQVQDLAVITRLEGSLNFILEEITARNLALALLALVSESGDVSLEIYSNPLFFAAINFVDTSGEGALWNANFPNCLITPRSAMSLISKGPGDWQNIPITAKILRDSSNPNPTEGFGTFYTSSYA